MHTYILNLLPLHPTPNDVWTAIHSLPFGQRQSNPPSSTRLNIIGLPSLRCRYLHPSVQCHHTNCLPGGSPRSAAKASDMDFAITAGGSGGCRQGKGARGRPRGVAGRSHWHWLSLSKATLISLKCGDAQTGNGTRGKEAVSAIPTVVAPGSPVASIPIDRAAHVDAIISQYLGTLHSPTIASISGAFP